MTKAKTVSSYPGMEDLSSMLLGVALATYTMNMHLPPGELEALMIKKQEATKGWQDWKKWKDEQKVV